MSTGMHWADIMAAIYKAGSTPAKVAKNEGVSPSLVTQVIRGNAVSHPIAYAIAAVTNIPTERMWPGAYLTPPAYQVARNGKTCGKLKQAANG